MIRALRLLCFAALLGLHSQTSAASDAAVPAGGMAPLESFSEVTARPLFAPDRRPRIRAVAAPPAGVPVLTAIIVLRDRRYAVLREGDAPARQVKEGDSIGGMKVKKILRDRIVTVAADGSETAMQLFPEQPAETAKTAPTSAAPPPAPVVTAGIPEMPPPGMAPVDNRPRKPLITSNP